MWAMSFEMWFLRCDASSARWQGLWYRRVDWTFGVSHRHVRFHHCPQMVTISTADCFSRRFLSLSKLSIPPKSVLFEFLEPNTSMRYWFLLALGPFQESRLVCFLSPGVCDVSLSYFWKKISRSKLTPDNRRQEENLWMPNKGRDHLHWNVRLILASSCLPSSMQSLKRKRPSKGQDASPSRKKVGP